MKERRDVAPEVVVHGDGDSRVTPSDGDGCSEVRGHLEEAVEGGGGGGDVFFSQARAQVGGDVNVG